MIKVLHLRSSATISGPERQILQLAEPLRRRGFEMGLLLLHRRRSAPSTSHPLIPEARNKGIEADTVRVDARFSPQAISRIARHLKEGRFHLLHTHDYKSDLLGLLAARLAGAKAVASARGYTDSTPALRLYKYIDLIVLRFFSLVIAVSEDLRRQLISARLQEERVITLHDGIDVTAFVSGTEERGERLRRRLVDFEGQPLIAIVGRLSPEKGHRYFLESAKIIQTIHPEAKFLILGEGPLRAELEGLAARLGIKEAVSFLGYQRDVAGYMAASDLVVLSSLREGLPNALLEALALGKAVVATRVGGVPEVIIEGQTGLLVPPKEPQRLAEKVVWLLEKPEEAAKMGERGRVRVVSAFSVEGLARKLAETYRQVLEGS
ncbi:MAG TPA: hypothetical protein DCP08_02695 [Chloroflexi bacterium]|nr:hypothetical protein [Chloroflexota bacterium]